MIEKPTGKYIFSKGHYKDNKGKEVMNVWVFDKLIGKPMQSDLFPARWKKQKQKNGFGIETDLHIKYATNTPELKEKYPMAFFVNSYLTGIRPSELYPNKLYGDNKKIGLHDALLFEFSDDREKLYVYVFEDMADNSQSLWEKWTAEKLCMTVETIPAEKENAVNLF